MIKVVMKIDGMHCGMCEAHVNDVVRKVEGVFKVTSSHSKGRVEIIAEDGADIGRMAGNIEAQGYRVLDCQSGPYEKKGLFGFRKK